ncbi:hypothetical protein CAEBREN_12091 [Caenorhabditis brenneri]|uniref:Uncharacterized protein n=1 Tax=Caenorhabditis brenneri TaxID=135651 RepID=G0NJW4_CAEBE|nr:hypothetical protein CAEBREN_12091 [Caenorhabditis brenneri]
MPAPKRTHTQPFHNSPSSKRRGGEPPKISGISGSSILTTPTSCATSHKGISIKFTLSYVSDESVKYLAEFNKISIEDMMSRVLGKGLAQKNIVRNLEVVSLPTLPVAVKFWIQN